METTRKTHFGKPEIRRQITAVLNNKNNMRRVSRLREEYETMEREAAVMCFDKRSGGGAEAAWLFGSTTEQRIEQHLLTMKGRDEVRQQGGCTPHPLPLQKKYQIIKWNICYDVTW